MNNSSNPAVGVCAVAKRALTAGHRIELAIGGFDVRGEAVTVADEPEPVPIGIPNGAVLRHAVGPGQTLRFSGFDMPGSRGPQRALTAGHRIELAIGGFDVRGEAVTVADEPEHVPIGILNGAVLRHAVEPGQTLRFSDVDIPDSRALQIVRSLAPVKDTAAA